MVIENKSERGTFEPVPEGIHNAVLVDVVDLGIEQTTYNNETKDQHKLKLVWQVPTELTSTDKVKTIGRKFTASLHEQSALRKTLNQWLGGLTPEQTVSLDLDLLIGTSAKLLVMNREIDGRMMHMVESVQPCDEKLEASADYVRIKDREELDTGY
ncbi:MAG: hypothetical protein CL569_07680 [Alphaproteobacteria bacterium]|nr:hypothetical protein [Alphaproteobacteria bacterium]|tara:strand:- start:515 stop:982 length:468 start_codon:yes stop_codon:yes gene_type:complete